MNFDEINDFCLSLKGAYLDFPFNEFTAVYKIAGKMFLMTALDDFPISIVIKCDPDESLELIDKYEFISTGYHMSKKHWISIITEESKYELLYKDLITKSYNLVYSKLTKKLKEIVNSTNI